MELRVDLMVREIHNSHPVYEALPAVSGYGRTSCYYHSDDVAEQVSVTAACKVPLYFE